MSPPARYCLLCMCVCYVMGAAYQLATSLQQAPIKDIGVGKEQNGNLAAVPRHATDVIWAGSLFWYGLVLYSGMVSVSQAAVLK